MGCRLATHNSEVKDLLINLELIDFTLPQFNNIFFVGTLESRPV